MRALLLRLRGLGSSVVHLARRIARPVAYSLACLVVVCLIVWLFWFLPKREIDPWRARIEPQQELAAEDAVRRTIAQVIGGAFLVLGLYFTWQNVVIAREGKITDRFSKAVDQLGSEKLEVRLGGIYALERIDRDSRRDHWTIVEVLCAFIVGSTQAPPPRDAATSPVRGTPWRLARHVQAACTVLGRRPWRHDEPYGLPLSGAHLEGANLAKGHFEKALFLESHLDGAWLTETHLEGALLLGAHLNEALFDDGTRLDGAWLWTAHLERTDLEGASMKGAHLQAAFLADADLSRVVGLTAQMLERATIERAKLPLDVEAALGQAQAVKSEQAKARLRARAAKAEEDRT